MTEDAGWDDVLPDLTAVEGFQVDDLLDLTPEPEREKLTRQLEEMVRVRRQAEADSATLRLS